MSGSSPEELRGVIFRGIPGEISLSITGIILKGISEFSKVIS